MEYKWPGNVRQLENVMERLVVSSEETEISYFDLPASMRDKLYAVPVPVVDKEQETANTAGRKPITIRQIIPLKEATMLVEKELIQMAKELNSSTYEIARLLGVDQSTVSRKLKQYAE